jgi:hypothetical protein
VTVIRILVFALCDDLFLLFLCRGLILLNAFLERRVGGLGFMVLAVWSQGYDVMEKL